MSQGTGEPVQRATADRRIPPARRRRSTARVAVAAAVAVLPMAAVLSIGSAAPLAPPLGPCSGDDCPNTWLPPHNGAFQGRDATINVFTGGDYTVNGRAAEAEGKVVALGNLTIDKDIAGGAGGSYNMAVVGVGSRVVPPDGTDFVTAGGSIDVKTGNTLITGGSDLNLVTAFGDIKYGGTLTGATDIAPTGRAIQDPAAGAPYRSVLDTIVDTSTCIAAAAATGTVVVTNSEATFTGDGRSAKQVFNVTQDLGTASRQIGLVFAGIPSGATVLVNVLKDDAIINTYTGTGLAGDPTTELRSRLMWNFPTASSVRLLGGAQFQGSVMAGNTAGTTTIAMPGLNGRVYLAGNLIHTGTGGYEIHSYPFDGDLPDCATTPSPTATTTSGSPTSSPTTPTSSPTTPTSSPTTPTSSPTTPTSSPTSPTSSPTRPTSSPTRPTSSPTKPTSSPTKPTSSPTKPTVKPTSPTATPTSPTATPASPSGSPTRPTDRPTSHSGHPTGHHPGHSSSAGGSELPSTGAGNGPVVLGLAGVGVLALGGLAVLVARRRGRHS
ncbi:choice-of-anchor A family protein [Kitasatospora sp. NPDC054939]